MEPQEKGNIFISDRSNAVRILHLIKLSVANTINAEGSSNAVLNDYY